MMIDTQLIERLCGFPVPPQTPALVIDRARLLANLEAMQAACDAQHVRLRPHGKMHKCSTLAKLQIEKGAVGLCCQTVGEAEIFARAGIADLLVSAPLPAWGAPRIAALARETGATIACVCDSAVQIDRLASAAQAERVQLTALVDVNIGMHRVGCSVDAAPALAAHIAASGCLVYGGVQAYFGHLQHSVKDRADRTANGTAILQKLVRRLSEEGLAPPQVTGGGSGTYALDLKSGVFTELQCGSYALMDAEYLDCGAPEGRWPFQPALFIAASVVAARHKSHVTIDLGLKATSIDVAPQVIAGAPNGSRWRAMGDEHGAIAHPGFLSRLADGADIDVIDADMRIAWPEDAPREGDIIWLLPGHCDPTINLYDAFYVVDGDHDVQRWPIDARRSSA